MVTDTNCVMECCNVVKTNAKIGENCLKFSLITTSNLNKWDDSSASQLNQDSDDLEIAPETIECEVRISRIVINFEKKQPKAP